jgi:hypothetical protein
VTSDLETGCHRVNPKSVRRTGGFHSPVCCWLRLVLTNHVLTPEWLEDVPSRNRRYYGIFDASIFLLFAESASSTGVLLAGAYLSCDVGSEVARSAAGSWKGASVALNASAAFEQPLEQLLTVQVLADIDPNFLRLPRNAHTALSMEPRGSATQLQRISVSCISQSVASAFSSQSHFKTYIPPVHISWFQAQLVAHVEILKWKSLRCQDLVVKPPPAPAGERCSITSQYCLFYVYTHSQNSYGSVYMLRYLLIY